MLYKKSMISIFIASAFAFILGTVPIASAADNSPAG